MSKLTAQEKPRENCWECGGVGIAVPMAQPIPCDACWPVLDGKPVSFEAFFSEINKGEGQTDGR